MLGREFQRAEKFITEDDKYFPLLIRGRIERGSINACSTSKYINKHLLVIEDLL